jgi:methyl-accepting chemotaxis protein
LNLVLVLSLLYILIVKKPEIYFNFEAHYYELDIPLYFKIFGLCIFTVIIIYYLSAIYFIFRSSGENRKIYIWIVIALFFLSIVPSYANVANRNGSASRIFYILSYCLCCLAGFFIILILFINNTKDKTSFLFKVVSVSFLSFVLIFSFISLVVSNDRENDYNSIHISSLKSILFANDEPSDLKYIIEFDRNTKETTILKKKVENQNLSPSSIELNYTDFFDKLEKEEYTLSNLNSIPLPFYLEGHKKEFINHYKSNTSISDFFKSKDKLLNVKLTKILELENTNFKTNLSKFLNKEYDLYNNSILEFIQTNQLDDKYLKSTVKNFLVKYKSPTDRRYYEDLNTNENYIAFHFITEAKIYEVGFSYLEYRKYLHSQTKNLLYLFLIGVVLFIIGTPLFLSTALVKPLMELLQGLRKVRKGDLSINVPIRVQDEIGFLSFSFNTMVKSIRESKEKLEEYSQGLEQKVSERTEELRNSLATVNQLKTQQDGDYFLTSLLLKPFLVNQAKSDRIQVDFLLSQKKKFEFHGKSYEIGGDLCHTQNIKISGKNYILFFNSDSMGKSLQGAGGAIVFGSVFFSIIERTNETSYKNTSPERWLKNAFIELHKVFLSFDGSMLVSSVIGLIDEQTGLLYFINAEHPWTVLYRDEVADFIETENYFYKLGSPVNSKTIFINCFQLQKGDIIIIGSDGRDDFEIANHSSESNRRINQDEKEFLKTVRECNANLQLIYQKTSAKGTITDDYSLIRIEYKGEEAYLKDFKSRAIKNFNEKKYKDALPDLLHYIEACPSDTEMMFITSHVLKLLKEYEKSINLSERVRLRNPTHIKNLTNLVQNHLALGNYPRARDILTEGLSIEPNHTKLLKLKEYMLNQIKKFSNEENLSN